MSPSKLSCGDGRRWTPSPISLLLQLGEEEDDTSDPTQGPRFLVAKGGRRSVGHPGVADEPRGPVGSHDLEGVDPMEGAAGEARGRLFHHHEYRRPLRFLVLADERADPIEIWLARVRVRALSLEEG